MVGDRQQPPDEHGNLSQARTDFLEGLEPRVGSLRTAVEKLRRQPASAQGRSQALRRVHALAASAKVLGFAAMAEQIAKIERSLSVEAAALTDPEFDGILSTLVALPGLGSTAARRSQRVPGRRSEPALVLDIVPPASNEPRSTEAPVSVMLIGDEDLEQALAAGALDAALEIERVPGDERAFERIQAAMPDVVVVDSALVDSRALLRAIRTDPVLRVLPVVTVRPEGAREDSEPRGLACSLARPVRGPEVWLAVQRAAQSMLEEVDSGTLSGEVSMNELVEHLVHELRRGLAPQQTGEEPVKIALGHGSEVLAPLWGALARIRRTISTATAGGVSFASAGPEGGVVFAPPSRAEELQGARQHAEGVSLRGRRALVVDDDDEVVKFISGLLVAVGAEVIQASDGQRALELALETWPDIVVSDILMPGLDGLELCRELKRDIVLRDTPVVLLSWKEDLLLRLRDLRSEADGYLRKEAGASSVLRTISELLAPRAHVAARLAAGGEVRGRLDGLTPRLILELAIAHRPDSRVSLRDAAYLYEVEIRDGSPRRVTRTASDGGFERGERVLSGLLGIGAGRFAVAHHSTPCRDDLQASLREMLEKPIRRARAALAATRAERLQDIERVVIEFEAIERYLPAMPRRASALLQQMADGASPRALLSSGGLPEGLLSSVLTDLARRGALSAVLVPGGEDLLDLSGALSGAVEGQQPPPGPPMFSFQLSPAPPALETVADDRREAAKNVLPMPRVVTLGRGSSPDPPAASIPPATTEVDAGWSSSRPPGSGAEANALAPANAPPSIELSAPVMDGSRTRAEGVPAPTVGRVIDQGSGGATSPRATGESRRVVSVRLPDFSQIRAPMRAEDDAPTRVAQQEHTVDLAEAVVRAVAAPTADPPPVAAAQGVEADMSDAEIARARTPSSTPPRTSLSPKLHILKAATTPVSLAEAAVERALAPAPIVALESASTGASGTAKPETSPKTGQGGGESGLLAARRAEPGPGTANGFAPHDPGKARQNTGDRSEAEPGTRVAIAAIPLVKAIARKQFTVREEMDAPPGQAREREAPGVVQRAAVTRMVNVGAPADDSLESTNKRAAATEKSRANDQARSAPTRVPRPGISEAASSDGARPGTVDEANAMVAAVSVAAAVQTRSHEGSESSIDDRSARPLAQVERAAQTDAARVVGDEDGSGPSPSPSEAAAEQDEPGGPSESGSWSGVSEDASGRDDAGTETPPLPLVSSGGWVKSIAAMLGAAAVAFGLVWWVAPVVKKPKPDIERALLPRAQGLEDASQSPEPSPSAEAPAIVPEELPLPDGYTLPAGKALLEIDTGGSHIIYVDGEFVGRGPLRYVTLEPGAHDVKTKLDDTERDDSINLRAGVRTRLPLAEAWKK